MSFEVIVPQVAIEILKAIDKATDLLTEEEEKYERD
jgi:hypothetical protein